MSTDAGGATAAEEERSEARRDVVTTDVASFSDAWDGFLLAVRRAQARRARADEDLSLSQYQLLLPLMYQSVPVGQLAQWAGIAAATATRVIDGLERSGAVERVRSAEDRRHVTVSLTDAGRARVFAKRDELEHRRERLYERLEPEERAQSEQLLRHLADLLNEI